MVPVRERTRGSQIRSSDRSAVPGAYKAHVLSKGAGAPNYGYSDDGVRNVPARFSYYCPPGSSEPAGPLFSYPYTHHLNGIAAPSRFSPAPEPAADTSAE